MSDISRSFVFFITIIIHKKAVFYNLIVTLILTGLGIRILDSSLKENGRRKEKMINKNVQKLYIREGISPACAYINWIKGSHSCIVRAKKKG